MAPLFPQGVSLPEMNLLSHEKHSMVAEKIEPLNIDMIDKNFANTSNLHVEQRVQFEMKAIHDGLKIIDETERQLTEWTNYWADNNQVSLPQLS